MAENKKRKKLSEDEKIAKARKRKVAIAKEPKVFVAETDQRESFRLYFIKLRKKLGLKRDLEEIIWTHLKAIGHDKEELFDAGIENFGYKLS